MTAPLLFLVSGAIINFAFMVYLSFPEHGTIMFLSGVVFVVQLFGCALFMSDMDDENKRIRSHLEECRDHKRRFGDAISRMEGEAKKAKKEVYNL